MADAYIRVGRVGTSLFGPPYGHDSLVFIDVDEDGGDIRSLREVPHRFMAEPSWIVVRATHASASEDVAEIVKLLQLRASAGLLVQVPGTPAKISWLSQTPLGAEGLEARARDVEMRALLHWRRCVWEAKTHHFLLPSGQHASGFVKLSNCISEPRDAEVLASWLVDRFDPTKVSALILDTGSLTPIALALKIKVGASLGRVAVLERYPSTDVDVHRAVQAAAITNAVVGLVSVCASGTVRDRLRNVFGWLGPDVTWSLDTIVDLRKEPQTVDGQYRSWTRVRHSDDTEIEAFEGDCRLCKTYDRSTLIPVDPAAFDAFLPTMRERHALDIGDARRNREFWNACQRSSCLTIENLPDEHIRPFRPTRERLPIKVDVGRLLEDDQFQAEAAQQLRILVEKKPGLRGVDLILCPDPESARVDRAVEIVRRVVGTTQRKEACTPDHWSDDLDDAIRQASKILILSPGTVTGFSLQRALAGVQRARLGTTPDYEVFGLSIHARPGRNRDWQTLSNSYAGRLDALFLSHWPRFVERNSPIQDEGEVLEGINPEDLSDNERAFWETRRAFCAGQAPETPLFWGQSDGQRLSAHSIFGDNLDAITTYSAVASAMHARRQMEVSKPHRLSFELPAIFRSYYDPLIIASVLRWLRPSEAWWGETPNGAETVIEDLFHRTSGMPDMAVLLTAELLLAGSLGKIPTTVFRDVVVPEAKRLRDTTGSAVMGVGLCLPAVKTVGQRSVG